jgi:hypothetical protein
MVLVAQKNITVWQQQQTTESTILIISTCTPDGIDQSHGQRRKPDPASEAGDAASKTVLGVLLLAGGKGALQSHALVHRLVLASRDQTDQEEGKRL